MIDVAELIHDPDFCVNFNIFRKSGSWVKGRWITEDEIIPVTGIVTAVNSKDLQILAEGDRTNGLKTFYAIEELRGSSDKATADVCEYKGKQYRLIQDFDYSDFGYYKAIGTFLGGVS